LQLNNVFGDRRSLPRANKSKHAKADCDWPHEFEMGEWNRSALLLGVSSRVLLETYE